MRNLALALAFLLVTSINIYSMNKENKTQTDKLETISFGAGCFWCVEAIFDQLKGVYTVESGYMGGELKNPSYKDICTGQTGHAEVCKITYDPTVIAFDELLEIFWQVHDPTTLNRQGNDVGTQYRSVIFYYTQKQKETAILYKEELNKIGAWDDPIITEISENSVFYKAENYHQDYYDNNKENPYCSMVVKPKQEKFKKLFKDKLK